MTQKTDGANTVQPIRDPQKIEEMKDLLKRNSLRNYTLFLFGINTGLRISDILKLKVSDIKGKERLTIRETKTRKNKIIKLNQTIQQALHDYIKYMGDEEWLFPSRQGTNALSRIQAYRILNTAAKQLNLEEIGTHTLRKTYGYHFYQKTKDVAMLQKLFNHSAPSVTLKYIGIDQDMMEKAMDEFSL